MWIYHLTLGDVDADVFESVELAVIEVHVACHYFVFHLRMFFEVLADCACGEVHQQDNDNQHKSSAVCYRQLRI